VKVRRTVLGPGRVAVVVSLLMVRIALVQKIGQGKEGAAGGVRGSSVITNHDEGPAKIGWLVHYLASAIASALGRKERPNFLNL